MTDLYGPNSLYAILQIWQYISQHYQLPWYQQFRSDYSLPPQTEFEVVKNRDWLIYAIFKRLSVLTAPPDVLAKGKEEGEEAVSSASANSSHALRRADDSAATNNVTRNKAKANFLDFCRRY